MDGTFAPATGRLSSVADPAGTTSLAYDPERTAFHPYRPVHLSAHHVLVRMPILWSQRYKANLAKLISGDIYQVAEVVRNLSLRERGKGLAGAEKRMLAKAREILTSELIFAVGSTEENAEAMLDEVLEESR